MNTILNNTNEVSRYYWFSLSHDLYCHVQLTKSVCTIQASFNKTNEHQSNELQSLSTQGRALTISYCYCDVVGTARSKHWIQLSTGEF